MGWWSRDKTRIEVDDEGVRRVRGATCIEVVTWRNLSAVDVRTTDEGPLYEDVHWVLSSRDGSGVALPQGQVPDGLLERLQALPGFDNEALIQAMGSTSNANFRCWGGEGSVSR